MSSLVLHQGDIDGFRATRMMQDKAQCAGNGESFSSAAKPYWIIRVAPHFERAMKWIIDGIVTIGRGES